MFVYVVGRRRCLLWGGEECEMYPLLPSLYLSAITDDTGSQVADMLKSQ